MDDKMIIKIKDRRVHLILSGNLWIYRTDIIEIDKEEAIGSTCIVQDKQGNPLAVGYYNKNSEIRVRILSFDTTIISLKDLVIERLKSCIKERNLFLKQVDVTGVRLVNSEGDFLPGLIIDKYSNNCVVQINSAGMANFKDEIAQYLLENIASTIIIKGDSPGLKKEGATFKNYVIGTPPEKFIQFKEREIISNFKPLDCQKTGAYLDIREPRMMMKDLSKDCTVLDCFCNSGLFGLHALSGGAKKVTFIDSGIGPIELLKKNIVDNKFENRDVEIIRKSVFDSLKFYEEKKETFDIIILDPPPFVKKRIDLQKGLKAYQSLLSKGLNILKNGGLLIIATCSAPVKEEIFLQTIVKASKNSKSIAKMIKYGIQDMDHPYIPNMEETNYLRYYILRKM
jgi:23S rRNA (cytosine1962-C5)-methyltransferase